MTLQQEERATAIRGVTRIDHFVLQVNDLWHSYEFYRDVLGAHAYQIAGMDTDRLWHRGNQILFIRIAHHQGVGLCICNVEVPLASRMFEHVSVGFEVTLQQFEQIRAHLERRGVPYVSPNTYPSNTSIAQSIAFQDPDGHTLEVCVRSSGAASAEGDGANGDGRLVPQRISHVGVEAMDVGRASRWFQDVLGFTQIAEHDGQAYLQIHGGDQFLVIRPTTELSPRRQFVRGPHVDFEVPAEDYPEICRRIQNREGYWDDAPHPFPTPRTVDYNVTTYFYDLDGNRYQVSPSGAHG